MRYISLPHEYAAAAGGLEMCLFVNVLLLGIRDVHPCSYAAAAVDCSLPILSCYSSLEIYMYYNIMSTLIIMNMLGIKDFSLKTKHNNLCCC